MCCGLNHKILIICNYEADIFEAAREISNRVICKAFVCDQTAPGLCVTTRNLSIILRLTMKWVCNSCQTKCTVLYCIVLYSSIYIAPLNSHRQTEALLV